MAQSESSVPRPQPSAGEENVWVIGFISFASVAMCILGTFHFIAGLSALFDETFYDVRRDYGLELDATARGWIHITIGILLLGGSIGVLAGTWWGRIIGILFAFASTFWNFYSIPYYPVWSILMTVVAIGVIWALMTHGKDFAFDTEQIDDSRRLE